MSATVPAETQRFFKVCSHELGNFSVKVCFIEVSAFMVHAFIVYLE